ncbi:MAG: MDR family MFS transporter [Anaerolineae bacterium]
MSRNRTILITAGVMLSLFMAAMESTVVSTAMPTIVADLGGLSIYSWVFSAYLLTSTTTMPLYGKLSDIYGRRPIFMIALALFLGGSVLSGQAGSMEQLILFRALQGLGAGGLQPLAFILIGDMFSFEQRAKMQGLFSGVWGISSIVGPLLGGFLVDQVSWHWVFYVNIVPGILAGAIIWFLWVEHAHVAQNKRAAIDYAGAAVLTLDVVVLLFGLFEFGTLLGSGLLVLAALFLFGLIWIERRAADPILPMSLFGDRLFSIALIQGVLAGCALFGSASFVPLFVQAVLGTSATLAGATLTPQLLGWVGASIIGSRLLLRMGYHRIAIVGMVILTIGAALMARIDANSNLIGIMVNVSIMGIGMGLSIPAFLLAVQNTVPRRLLGTATSTVQFSRSIGGAIGVSIMGIVLAARLTAGLIAAGMNPDSIDLDSLLNPVPGANIAVEGALRIALANAVQSVFVVALIAAVLGLVATTLTPRGHIAHLIADRKETEAGGQAPAESGLFE